LRLWITEFSSALSEDILGYFTKDDPMKITFILPCYPWHPIGGFRIVYQYANFLAQHGHSVSVVHAYDTRQTPMPAPHNLRLLRTTWRRVLTWQRSKFPPQIAWQDLDSRVNMIFLRGEPAANYIPDGDAIFATRWDTAEYVAEYPKRKGAKLYLIQHYEAMMGPKARVDATWLLPLHKVVISCWLYELGMSMGAENLRHIPNAIDHAVFKVLTPPDTREPSIAALYHTLEWKGVADALEALCRLHDRYPTVPVTMFGGVPERPDLPEWVHYYHDPSQDALVREVYNGHSIYLAASWAEGWALPPAEAMACGCAFVGTDIGGFRDYAVHETTALLSPPKDPAALYHNLCRVVEDSNLRQRLQQAGTEYIRTFTWERSGVELERYIAQVIEMNRAKASTGGKVSCASS
jgi:glycosyltransferase involved in cell wall biosynthesis